MATVAFRNVMPQGLGLASELTYIAAAAIVVAAAVGLSSSVIRNEAKRLAKAYVPSPIR